MSILNGVLVGASEQPFIVLKKGFDDPLEDVPYEWVCVRYARGGHRNAMAHLGAVVDGKGEGVNAEAVTAQPSRPCGEAAGQKSRCCERAPPYRWDAPQMDTCSSPLAHTS